MFHLADLIVRIKNAHLANKDSVEVIHTNLNENVLKVLEKEGYVSAIKVFKEGPFKYINVTFKDAIKPINEIKVVSKPGLRIYSSKDMVKKNKKNLGVYVISTTKGVMTNAEAIKKNLGGEVLCKVY